MSIKAKPTEGSLLANVLATRALMIRSHKAYRAGMCGEYAIYVRVLGAETETVELKAIVKERGAKTSSRTDTALLVVKATDPEPENSKAHNERASVMRKAQQAGVTVNDFPAWLDDNGGTNTIRRGDARANPANRRDAIAKAETRLDAITKPMALVKAAPMVVEGAETPKYVIGILRPAPKGGLELLRLEADKSLTDAVLYHLGKVTADESDN